MTDLAGVIAGNQGGNANMRIGTVTAFDAGAGTLTVNVGGTDLPGVFYNPAYLPLIGDVVAVLNAGPTWYVLGSTVNATARTTPVTAQIDTQEATTSATYTDLATPGPAVTVTVGASGRVLVLFNARCGWSDNTVDAVDGAYVTVAASGANTIAPLQFGISDYRQFTGTTGNVGVFSGAAMKLFTGLTSGPTTFTLKYRSASAGKSVDFGFRIIAAFPY